MECTVDCWIAQGCGRCTVLGCICYDIFFKHSHQRTKDNTYKQASFYCALYCAHIFRVVSFKNFAPYCLHMVTPYCLHMVASYWLHMVFSYCLHMISNWKNHTYHMLSLNALLCSDWLYVLLNLSAMPDCWNEVFKGYDSKSQSC